MLSVIALSLAAPASVHASAQNVIEAMPVALEAEYALSALPPAMRPAASVYLLDPGSGYQLAQQGISGVTCIVQRTVWELGDYRDDIYIPLCYDAAGTQTYLKVIMDAAKFRAEGMGPEDLKAQTETRFKDGTYKAPAKPGLSYMLAPVMRTIGPPDRMVHTMSMPHVMFYAPNVTNEDIGALPNLADPATLLYPLIDRQGNDEQSYIVQMTGGAEKAKIVADGKQLLDSLCGHRDILCLSHEGH
ncbi:MAG: hypothetical protein H0W74_08760 [Sphingosinicella sp.]|nr:hypothetical protein [Sphingosinicella sp.]